MNKYPSKVQGEKFKYQNIGRKHENNTPQRDYNGRMQRPPYRQHQFRPFNPQRQWQYNDHNAYRGYDSEYRNNGDRMKGRYNQWNPDYQQSHWRNKGARYGQGSKNEPTSNYELPLTLIKFEIFLTNK